MIDYSVTACRTFLRRGWPCVVAGALIGMAIAASDASEPPVLKVERGVRQLFLDDVGIDRLDALERVLHRPQRHPANPVIEADTPWEKVCSVYGTALYDEQRGRFRLWYLTSPRDRGFRPLDVDGHARAPHTTLAAYAESNDGVHWTKPELGLFPYDGSRANNLLGLGHNNCEGISVLDDPRDPEPGRRFKAVYWDHGSGGFEVRDGKPYCKPGPDDGLYVAWSADGIHWTAYEGNPVIPRYCDTNQNLLYDPGLGCYVTFSRLGFGRRMARSQSADFLHWNEPQLVLECDAADGEGTQIYGAGVDRYEGVYLAMLWIYRELGDAKIDTQLATSRDGMAWTRVAGRATWLELGPDDSWEGGMVRSVERIITRGDKLFIYYGGVHGPHTGPKFKSVERLHRGAVGLLTLRRDGFVSLRGGTGGGRLITRPFALPEGELHLNVAARAGGQIRVVLVSGAEDGQRRVLAEAEPVTGDRTSAPVAWRAPPAVMPGARVRLEADLVDADLFAYWWQ